MKINELATLRFSQIEAFRASGQTAAEWCKENSMGVNALSTKPLVPTNIRIITGKVFIWSILAG